MAAEEDFVIALRTVNFNGKALSTYFGKIGGRCQSGDHLSEHEGLIEIILDAANYPVINTMTLYAQLSAYGTQCRFNSVAEFRDFLDAAVNRLNPGPPAKKKGGRRTRSRKNRNRRTRRTRK